MSVKEPELEARLRELARTPTLLVACDYDGTLSPIVDDPELAYPEREAVAALRALSALPDTHVAVVSGRSLRDLAALSRLPSEIHLVGSHGSEFDAGFATALSRDTVVLRETVTRRLAEIATRDPGFQVEKKPASAAFHYRNAGEDQSRQAIADILSGPGELPGVNVKHGKMVVELTVVETDKGKALDILRRQIAAEAVIFMGDDVTDEDAFAHLGGPDVGIKVGSGETAAEFRIGDTQDGARVLALLGDLRRAWLEGAGAPPIEHHALLSDLRTVALVTPEARINWLCHPRADSPGLFADLVGGPQAGFFAVHPGNGAAPLSQRYVPGTMVLETRWAELTVTDYFDVSDGRPAEPAGRSNLIRRLEGNVAEIEFAPRVDYGRAATRVEVTDAGLRVRGTSHDIQLHVYGLRDRTIDWTIHDEGPHQTARGRIVLGEEPLVFDLALAGGPAKTIFDEASLRDQTLSYWREWASRLDLPGLQEGAVLRSALTLKALCHHPTGAILAAATTSLPEVPGGVRNWDYRYCWPRDAAMTAISLVALGSTSEARDLFGWLIERVAQAAEPGQLRPLYAAAGDEFLPEAVLPTLHGYLGSRPVRIGNAADQQVQLDVFGPVVELVYRLTLQGEVVADEVWEMVEGMVEGVSRRWQEPDNGLWEARRPQRHHVYSKVMCWLAVDRGIRIAESTGRSVVGGWPALRKAIEEEILELGWSDVSQSFTVAYGETDLDASALWIGLSGLLDVHDPRFTATVAAIERDLCHGPIVYRYRLNDGLPGNEGGFLVCTTWLIEAYVRMGRLRDARDLFTRYCALAGPTGLLSEQYDPGTGLMLGNHPQAYSHLGLINAAVAISHGVPPRGV